jgi:aryl-alcohol dehydrogenase-like predicted oxidoreductase
MIKRKLGDQGLEVSAIGLGCMGMSFAYGKADEAESLRTLHRSLELGINFWDTAEIYGPFKNEVLLAKALAGRRNKVIVATKFAWRFAPDGTRIGLDGSRNNMRQAIEGSLKRLGTDYIDLFYQHRLDPNTPIEETVSSMSELVKEGKVRYIGLSEVGPVTIRKAHKIHPLTAVQSEYSLWERRVEEKVLPILLELGIGFVAYSPFGRGFLAGKIRKYDNLPEDDFRRSFPRFEPINLNQNLKLVDEIGKLAASRKMTTAQMALAWALNQGKGIVPIPGTTKPKHLEENTKVVGYKLPKKDKDAIDTICQQFPAAGARLPEEMLKLVDVP